MFALDVITDNIRWSCKNWQHLKIAAELPDYIEIVYIHDSLVTPANYIDDDIQSNQADNDANLTHSLYDESTLTLLFPTTIDS